MVMEYATNRRSVAYKRKPIYKNPSQNITNLRTVKKLHRDVVRGALLNPQKTSTAECLMNRRESDTKVCTHQGIQKSKQKLSDKKQTTCSYLERI